MAPVAYTDGLVRLGWDDDVESAYTHHAPPGCDPGRVVRVDVDSCLVHDGSEEVRTLAEDLPAAGDWVALDRSGPVPRVAAVLPRRSELARADERRRQVLAANVDVVLVVTPLDRAEPLADLERTLAVAAASEAQPVVVLTKADVHDEPGEIVSDVEDRAPGVAVAVVDALKGTGVDAVHAYLEPHRTGVMLGPSGAGKSTLANALFGEEVLATGEVREDGEGRHTTTSRRLLVIPGGGVLIDIPGLRTLGLADAEPGLARLYADLEDLAAACRFSDCAHEGEPGCAIEQAVAAGEVKASRVTAWRRLAGEIELEAERAARRRGRPRR